MRASTVFHKVQKCFFIFLLLLAGLSNKAFATHFAAADLYIDFVDSNASGYRYQVTLVCFKACEPNNASLSDPEYISYTSACGFSGSSIAIPKVSGPDTLDQLCPAFKPNNACRVDTSIWPAFVRQVYRTILTFPTKCSNVTVSWSGCDRNYGIQNIQCQNNSPKCLYIEASMNTMARASNHTPRFTIDPIPYLCDGQPSFFLNGPLDPENDSVITTNVQPLSSAGTTIPYLTNYSLANPLASSTGYSVNPNTGTASFTPSIQGKFVLAFEAADYDRVSGTQLSHIRRDVQVSILNCNAPPPSIDSIPVNLMGAAWIPTPPSSGYIVACAGQPMSFNISSSSLANTNSVFLSSNSDDIISGSSFSVAGQGTGTAVGTFTWTPTNLDVGDYTLIITAKDSTCTNNQPIVMKNYFTVQVKVFSAVDAGPDGRICKIDGTPWQFNVQGPEGYKYRWTSISGGPAIGLSDDTLLNPTAYPPFNFTYVVEALGFFSVCKNRDTVTVYIDTSNSVIASPKDPVVCRPGYLQLTAQGVGLPPLMNLNCGVFDTVTCTNQDTLVVSTQYIGGIPVLTKVYSPYQGYRTSKIQFLLSRSDLRSYGIRSGTLKGLAFEVTGLPSPNYAQYNNFTISLKCTDRESLDAATGGMESGTTPVYTSTGPVTTTLGWNQFTFDHPYSVDSTKALIVEICYNNTNTYPLTALSQVSAVNTETVQTAIMHSTSATGTTGICQNPTISSATDFYTARPNIRFNLCAAGEVPFNFVWNPGDFLSDSTVQSPLAYVKTNTKYVVTTIGRNGCKVQDSILITVPVHDYDIWPKDTSFCLGGSFLMKALGGYDHVKWYEGDKDNFRAATTLNCDDCREPVGTPTEDTKYFAVMTDVYGCSDTMMVNAVVRPLPNVHILNDDTTIKYGQSIQLLVSGAYLYSWQPLSTISNPNIGNPYASPTEPTTYYVYGIGDNGCRNVDSVHINIDYRDNLFVPSAFTPNGDGKNDVFRVTNITFQKLQEFRVFNRWGQEIYSTTDPKKGWDGTWKGVPQDMGAYQYLIRVAYPDGYIETYKGDVTLVR